MWLDVIFYNYKSKQKVMAEESLLDYKPSGLQFVEANEALLACYQDVDLESYNKMSVG